jgi:hypothetical protein
MTLKPTHQSIIGYYDVLAWQNLADAGVPTWVAKNFHSISTDGVLSHITGVALPRGSWIVRFFDGAAPTQAGVVLTNKEFKMLYRPL